MNKTQNVKPSVQVYLITLPLYNDPLQKET